MRVRSGIHDAPQTEAARAALAARMQALWGEIKPAKCDEKACLDRQTFDEPRNVAVSDIRYILETEIPSHLDPEHQHYRDARDALHRVIGGIRYLGILSTAEINQILRAADARRKAA